MTIEDIISTLEKHIRNVNEEALLIMQKEIETCRIKVYKKYKYTLWYLDRKKDIRFPIIYKEITSKVSCEEDDALAKKQIELLIISEIFKYIKEFNFIDEKNYDQYESVSNSIN